MADRIAITLLLIRGRHPKSRAMWKEAVEAIRALEEPAPMVWCRIVEELASKPPKMPQGADERDWGTACRDQMRELWKEALREATGGSLSIVQTMTTVAPVGAGAAGGAVAPAAVAAGSAVAPTAVAAGSAVAPTAVATGGAVAGSAVAPTAVATGGAVAPTAVAAAVSPPPVTKALPIRSSILPQQLDQLRHDVLLGHQQILQELREVVNALKYHSSDTFSNAEILEEEPDLDAGADKADEGGKPGVSIMPAPQPVDVDIEPGVEPPVPLPIGKDIQDRVRSLIPKGGSVKWIAILPSNQEQKGMMGEMVRYFSARAEKIEAMKKYFPDPLKKGKRPPPNKFITHKDTMYYANQEVIQLIVQQPVGTTQTQRNKYKSTNNELSTILKDSICPATLFVLYFNNFIEDRSGVFRDRNLLPQPFKGWPYEERKDGEDVTFYNGGAGITVPHEDADAILKINTRNPRDHFIPQDLRASRAAAATKAGGVGAELEYEDDDWLNASIESSSSHEPDSSPRG